jgi:hypothetical protein
MRIKRQYKLVRIKFTYNFITIEVSPFYNMNH